jgi:hypothetical protein
MFLGRIILIIDDGHRHLDWQPLTGDRLARLLFTAPISEARVTEVVIFTVTPLGYITLGPAIDLIAPELRLVCLLHFNLLEYGE